MSRSNFRNMRIHPDDVDLFAACFAQIAYQMDPFIDEVESFEIIRARLVLGQLNYMDAVELGTMMKTTKAKASQVWN